MSVFFTPTGIENAFWRKSIGYATNFELGTVGARGGQDAGNSTDGRMSISPFPVKLWETSTDFRVAKRGACKVAPTEAAVVLSARGGRGDRLDRLARIKKE